MKMDEERQIFLDKYHITNGQFLRSKYRFINLDRQMYAIYCHLKYKYKLINWKYIDILFADEIKNLYEYKFIFRNYIYTDKLEEDEPILVNLIKDKSKSYNVMFSNTFDTTYDKLIFTLDDLSIIIDEYITVVKDKPYTFKTNFKKLMLMLSLYDITNPKLIAFLNAIGKII